MKISHHISSHPQRTNVSWLPLFLSLFHILICIACLHTVYILYPTILHSFFLSFFPTTLVSFVLSHSHSHSFTGKPLNHPCSYDEQCHLVDGNSHCSNATICKCVNGFLSFNGSCHNLQERNKNSSTSNEINLEMLPIMIVLGLMFIGMCVALNMFSR